jgi:hypothetical protein
MAYRTSLEVLKIEPEKIVPFDYFRVPLANYPDHFRQHRGFVHLIARQHALEAGRISQRQRARLARVIKRIGD